MRLALLRLPPLAGRGRIPNGAQAERRNPGEGNSRRSQFVESPPHPARSWRCSPASPRKRGEVKRRRAPLLAPMRRRGSIRPAAATGWREDALIALRIPDGEIPVAESAGRRGGVAEGIAFGV